ncbi:MAG: SAM-dependent methyltransferase [Clostridia bacterium]|nr:SAM-dependent methyltransferase [Clostridia bacterium]
MHTPTTPGARLLSAVPYLRKGCRVVDVGTDHAYLPIHLVREGLVAEALACDVNQGPITAARANVAAAGLADRIGTRLTDGLHGVEDFSPDSVLIFGMGGELIVKILSEAPWIRNESIGLVLQPMSRAAVLRRWLLENGFSIEGETLTYEDKYYQTLAARYTGRVDSYSDVELAVGRLNIETRPPLFEGFVRHEIAVLEAVLRGKAKSAQADTSFEEYMKRSLESLL